MQLDTPSGPKIMLHIKPGWSGVAAKGDSQRINPFGLGRGLQVLPGSIETALSVSASLCKLELLKSGIQCSGSASQLLTNHN